MSQHKEKAKKLTTEIIATLNTYDSKYSPEIVQLIIETALSEASNQGFKLAVTVADEALGTEIVEGLREIEAREAGKAKCSKVNS